MFSRRKEPYSDLSLGLTVGIAGGMRSHQKRPTYMAKEAYKPIDCNIDNSVPEVGDLKEARVALSARHVELRVYHPASPSDRARRHQ